MAGIFIFSEHLSSENIAMLYKLEHSEYSMATATSPVLPMNE